MRIGLALGMFEQSTGTPVRVEAVTRQAQAAEDAGFDSVWVMDHYWLARNEQRLFAHEPLVLLTHIAARTSSLMLGTMALCQLFRPLPQLARELASLADASGDRLVVGLGAGWHIGELDAAGVERDHPIARLEASVPALTELLVGGRVSTDLPWLHLREAEVASTGLAPPIWIAGRGDRLLRLAVRAGKGWNLAWAGSNTAPVRHYLERFEAARRDADRDRVDMVISLGVKCNLSAEWSDNSPEVSGGSFGLHRMMTIYCALGVDHLIIALAPMPYAYGDAGQIAVAAEALQQYRSGAP